jgi:hypothetical protein
MDHLVTLTGRLVEAVESGCVVLRTDDGHTFTLVGPPVAGLVGVVGGLRLRGHVETELLSHCMQGPVFVVTEVLRDA